MTTQKIFPAALILFLATEGLAQQSGSREHHLFHPVPDDQLRPLAADRPDATESPQTVDAGHVQLEADIAAYLSDRGGRDTAFAFAATNLKIGLLSHVDAQFVFAPYVRAKTGGPAGSRIDEGISNLTIRTKINLWGNDGETKTALAILPLIDLPLGGSSVGEDDVTGGVIVPFSTSLPGGWGLGAQVRFDLVRNADDDGYTEVWSQSAVLSHAIAGDLGGFLEFVSVIPAESGAAWYGTFNLGLTYGLDENVQLDAGTYVGVNGAAPDLVVFVGLTWRF